MVAIQEKLFVADFLHCNGAAASPRVMLEEDTRPRVTCPLSAMVTTEFCSRYSWRQSAGNTDCSSTEKMKHRFETRLTNLD